MRKSSALEEVEEETSDVVVGGDEVEEHLDAPAEAAHGRGGGEHDLLRQHRHQNHPSPPEPSQVRHLLLVPGRRRVVYELAVSDSSGPQDLHQIHKPYFLGFQQQVAA